MSRVDPIVKLTFFYVRTDSHEDGIVVSFDGAWQKRGTGRAYNSLTGELWYYIILGKSFFTTLSRANKINFTSNKKLYNEFHCVQMNNQFKFIYQVMPV